MRPVELLKNNGLYMVMRVIDSCRKNQKYCPVCRDVVRKHRFEGVLYLILLCTLVMNAQDSMFVSRSGSKLIFNTKTFYAIGVNGYFLQNLAAYGDTAHLNEIFQEARQLGITAIRTWGFYDSPDSTDPAVIQLSPGKYNERGLMALDRVIAVAKQCSTHLVIPLVNSWDDYGGMNQYVRWYTEKFPKLGGNVPQAVQKIIRGADGRSYRFFLSAAYTHDDFYTNAVIRQWYEDYIYMILNRTNTITNTKYKDEPAILAWELANEPRSSDRSGNIVANWMDEISAFIKSTDQNHLVSSGEEGFDISSAGYSDISRYNYQAWLFDGTAGSSFRKNSSLNNIDVAGIHCYTEYWGLTGNQGVQWLSDHNRIADNLRKPLILGEAGKQVQPVLFYTAIFNEALMSTTAGVLLWEFVYDGRRSDGFAFSYPKDSAICNVIQINTERFGQKSDGNIFMPTTTQLLQNYPNPFNSTTEIRFTITDYRFTTLKVYDLLSREVAILVDEVKQPGIYTVRWDASVSGGLPSGVYFCRLRSGNFIETKKLILMK